MCGHSCLFLGCVSLIRSRHIERTILSCNEPHANHAKRPHFMAAEPFLGGDGVLIWTLTTHQCSLLLFRESASVFTFNHHGSRPFFLHLHIQWLNVLSLHAYREKHSSGYGILEGSHSFRYGRFGSHESDHGGDNSQSITVVLAGAMTTPA